MNNQGIKSYDELNADEHAVLNTFRDMKIECDKARFELMSYQLTDLINDYQQLLQLRDTIREKNFSLMEKINDSGLADIDIDYVKWDILLTNEKIEWNEEIELISELKYYLDDLLMQLNTGVIEQMIIEEERNID